MPQSTRWFLDELDRRGVSRRDFMVFCGVMAAALALPRSAGRHASPPRSRRPRSRSSSGSSSRTAAATPSRSCARAARRSPRSCSTRSRSTTTRRSWPPPATRPRTNLAKAVKDNKGKYIAVVEGSIPTGVDGAYCTIGGRSALEIAREVCGGRRRHDRHRHLRDVRRPSRGRAEPDRRARRRRRRPGRQEPHQPLGLPGQRREPDGADRLLPDLQALAAARRVPPPALRLRQGDPRQLRAARPLRRRAVRRGLGRRGAPHRLLPLQDGLQGPGHVPELPQRPLERAAPTGRSAAATRASAAPSPTSGTR